VQRSKPPFTLFQRDGTKNWSMRFSMGGKQVRKSLETDDRFEAERRALELWGEANYRLKNGLSVSPTPFSKVAEDFISRLSVDVERGERSPNHLRDWPPVIRRYLIGFFADKPVDTIREPDLEHYLEWRRQYWVTGPGKDIEYIHYERAGKRLRRKAQHKAPALSRQRTELVIARALFEQAAKWGFVHPLEMPTIQARRRVDNRRPSFAPEEFERLLNTSLQRIYPKHDGGEKVIHARDGREWQLLRQNGHVLAERVKLHAYIEIAAGTGMRPPEMKNLNWGDILGFRDVKDKPIREMDIRIRVRGKGKSGTLVPLLGTIPWFRQLWELFEQECEREPTDDDPVFANHHGKRIQSFKKGFAELLKACNLTTDHRGVRRTSYSLRHYYISSLIAQGVSVHDVARNTRTSIAMIDKHYAQVSVEQIKNNLRPGQAEW
jgi:integrase